MPEVAYAILLYVLWFKVCGTRSLASMSIYRNYQKLLHNEAQIFELVVYRNLP